jgi:Zn-finger in ubiquitin-hydrolases and other protein
MGAWRVRDGEATCAHAAGADGGTGPADGCEDCRREGTQWVHLRRCLTCGHVGCCDSSPRRHATGHWRVSGHPVVASAEAGEHWAWCYADGLLLVPDSPGSGGA